MSLTQFVHRPHEIGETIAAIATPPGEGGIAVIRISGFKALDIGAKVFSGPLKSYETHTVHLGSIIDEKGDKIDQALAIVMRAPRSYTGEDTVEFHCHGGMIASRRVLEAVLRAGARLSSPGEFTLKAFMNGKIDLTQAESIQQLIHAKSEKAFDMAEKHLEGQLSKKIKAFQSALVKNAAIFEAWVDFPEEGLEFTSLETMEKDLEQLVFEIGTLLKSYHEGKKLEYGITLSIIGAPNVGKSSLMNQLLGKERAIVTPIAGTTRDLLEEDLHLNGLSFRLIDTAGIRKATDVVEQEGIRRSHQAIQSADLILFVLDASEGLGTEVSALLQTIPMEKTIVIWNKIDLPHPPVATLLHPHVVLLSAKEKRGFDTLKQMIDKVIWSRGAPPKEEVVLTSARHHQALWRAKEHLEKVVHNLKNGQSPEFLVFDLRCCLFELGTIIGTNVSEDILSSIFSQFCIGK